jgi:thiamine-phosphate pyrophosphorylase
MAFRFPDPIYPIIDPGNRPDRTHVSLAEAILAGGARFVQLRIKSGSTSRFVEIARAVRRLADRYAAALIVNDRVDIAQLVGAAGVHLGQEDLCATDARKWLGSGKIIGVSTHNLPQAQAAIDSGAADYLGFGPIFPTTNKSNPDPIQGIEGLRQVRRHCRLPLVAIGGITRETLADVLDAGADTVAAIGAIAQQSDPCDATRELLERARSAKARIASGP